MGASVMIRFGWEFARRCMLTCVAWTFVVAGPAWASDPQAAQSARSDLDAFLQSISEGGVLLNARARFSHADIENLAGSHVGTLRTRLGYASPPVFGFSGLVEMENIVAFDDHGYFDGVAPNGGGRSPIADVEHTEVNRALLRFEDDTRFHGVITLGRQRIKLDDDRFIGNVGWRQNEQTFDALRLQSSLGVAGLELDYAYVDDVRRIFGNQGGAGAATRDFESNSHLLRVAYSPSQDLKLVAFGYLLDLRNADTLSTNTVGTRASGRLRFDADGPFSLGYVGSYAYQADGGTSGGTNPLDFEAHYALAELSPKHDDYGAIGVGFELLGSDSGRAQFTTPLATAHKFQGFADVFLNNGGAAGVRDLYVFVAPRLPLGLKGKLVFHQFWADDGSSQLGHEIDAVVVRKFGKHLTWLNKFAFFQGERSASPGDRVRFTTQLEFALP